MEKEFEALRDDKLRIGLLGLKRLFEANAKKMTKDEIMAFDFTFMNITKALTELQAIKESNSSEALECVEDLIFNFSVDEYVDRYDKNLATIKQSLLKAQEQEKVLEILFEKNVDIEKLKYRLRVKDDDVYLHYKYDLIMTREEFDLLKEWIEKCH